MTKHQWHKAKRVIYGLYDIEQDRYIEPEWQIYDCDHCDYQLTTRGLGSSYGWQCPKCDNWNWIGENDHD